MKAFVARSQMRLPWWLVILAAFGVVYACSFTPVYVEGDDARSIAYHALGRVGDLEPPYAYYQSGADLLLRVFPPDEPVLRGVSIALTSVAMVVFSMLVLLLVFDLMGRHGVRHRERLALVVILAIPELFYLGLVYDPSVIGMCFALGAHLVIRRALRNQEAPARQAGPRSWAQSAAAAALLGLAGAFRWSLVLYGWIIFCDWVLGVGRQPTHGLRGYLNRCLSASAWGLMAAIVWLGALALSGYGSDAIIQYYRFVLEWSAYRSAWQVWLAADLALATPALAALCVLGAGCWLRERSNLLPFAVLAALPAFPAFSFWPKVLLWIFPILILLLAAGYVACYERNRHGGWGKSLQIGVGVLLVIPWMVGLQMTSGESAWGPGFEVRPFDRTGVIEPLRATIWRAGSAVPTPEGPRPLWGHAGTLVGGAWRRFTSEAAEERKTVVRIAVTDGLPIIVLQGETGYVVTELARLGFTTSDGFMANREDPWLSMRRFTRGNQSVLLLKLRPQPAGFFKDGHRIQEVIEQVGHDEVVVTSYPGSLRALFKVAPSSMRKLGPSSAVVSLTSIFRSQGAP